MLLTEKIGEGHQGLFIEISLIDQYAITEVVNRLKEVFSQRDAYAQWEEKRNALSWKERQQFEEENPRPIQPQLPIEEFEKAFVFLKKLALNQNISSNIFSESEE